MPMQYFKLLLYLYISFQSFDAFGKASNLLKTCASYPQMFYAIRWHVYAHAASLDSCKRFHCCVLFIRFSVVEQSWCDLKVRSENTPRMKEDVYTAFSLVTTCITIPYIMIFQCHNIETSLGYVDFYHLLILLPNWQQLKFIASLFKRRGRSTRHRDIDCLLTFCVVKFFVN